MSLSLVFFFTGQPHRILQAWGQHRMTLLLSPPIFVEYRRVGNQLARQYRGIDLSPVWNVLMTHSEFIEAMTLPHQICQDRDDDKFLACAIAGGGESIVSDNRELLKVFGYQNIQVLRPWVFVNTSLN